MHFILFLYSFSKAVVAVKIIIYIQPICRVSYKITILENNIQGTFFKSVF